MSEKLSSGLDISARYARQIVLPGFGEDAQRAISKAHVAVIGTGGLGSPVLSYLVAGGVGKLTIIDDDHVELINLHRQTIHTPEMLGVAKVESAREALEILNPEVELSCIAKKITRENAVEFLAECDLVCDCCDNFETRFVIDDACHELMLPVVYGAVTGWHGQVTVFLHHEDPTAKHQDVRRLRDLFPEQPQKGSVPKSNVAGILGPFAGMLGCMMATEALKISGGIHSTLTEKIVTLNGQTMSWDEIKFPSSKVNQ